MLTFDDKGLYSLFFECKGKIIPLFIRTWFYDKKMNPERTLGQKREGRHATRRREFQYQISKWPARAYNTGVVCNDPRAAIGTLSCAGACGSGGEKPCSARCSFVSAQQDSSGTLRIMLYSHDSWGLGHLRRTLAIAHAINRQLPGSSLLVATGSPNATSFPVASGIDVLKLPSVTKDAAGRYQARQLNDDLDQIIQLRSGLLQIAFSHFRPDVLIVDHQLVGLAQEALPVLKAARQAGTHCIYGMRDVLDSVEATEAGWSAPECRWALLEGYDEIWIYGDATHFPTARFYPTLQGCDKPMLYTGLITNGKLVVSERPSLKPHVLATIGGGEDGGRLLISFLQGMVDKPHIWDSTIVTGPLLGEVERDAVMQLAERLPGVTLHQFHQSIPGLMRSCDLVLSMAGYNTCAELVASECRAVLVPRTTPRTEQLIRAQYLQNSGIAKCLISPSAEQLYFHVREQLFDPSSATGYPNTNGLDIVARRCQEIAAARSPAGSLPTQVLER